MNCSDQAFGGEPLLGPPLPLVVNTLTRGEITPLMRDWTAYQHPLGGPGLE